MNNDRQPSHYISRMLLLLCLVLPSIACADVVSLEHGFDLLYDLKFDAAQREFTNFQQLHPNDPLGPVSEASGVLFAQLNQLGILESSFFVNDTSFRRLGKQQPDPVAYKQFDSALKRARTLAEKRLESKPGDHDALFAITLDSGLRADYAALIADKKVEALHYTKAATASAEQLLSSCSDCYDAYVATGISGYLIGSLAAPMRWVLRLGGFSGDKQKGISQLQLAAEHGRYLGPFARILLAIAYLREKEPERTRQLLSELHEEYPQNTIFTNELARLNGPAALSSRYLPRPVH